MGIDPHLHSDDITALGTSVLLAFTDFDLVEIAHQPWSYLLKFAFVVAAATASRILHTYVEHRFFKKKDTNSNE